MDVCSEIINNYLERPNRNLSRLMDYARKLRVGTIQENGITSIDWFAMLRGWEMARG